MNAYDEKLSEIKRDIGIAFNIHVLSESEKRDYRNSLDHLKNVVDQMKRISEADLTVNKFLNQT